MPEVDTGFEQILQLRLRHALPFLGYAAAALASRFTPLGGDPDGIKRRVDLAISHQHSAISTDG